MRSETLVPSACLPRSASERSDLEAASLVRSGLIADVKAAKTDLRFGPTETRALQQIGSLFDHLISAKQ